MSKSRYARQIAFHGVGVSGQEKLSASTVAVVGIGALGTVVSDVLCRAGVGCLRLVDRDYVEFTNLQRQVLFTESDAVKRSPKAVAACEYLAGVNSEIVLEPVVSEVNSGNIVQILGGVDLVLDAVDNWETRFLINEWSVKNGVTWIYSAALGSQGMTMNFCYDKSDKLKFSTESQKLPSQLSVSNRPCLRCFIPADQPQTQQQSCATAGILAMTTGTIASIQAAEAIKILTNANTIREDLLTIDVWNNRFKNIKIDRDIDCPVCVRGEYEYLLRSGGMMVQKLCGRDSIQIVPDLQAKINLELFAENLKGVGKLEVNQYILNFANEEFQFTLFQDGRAIIENAKDEIHAKSIYNEFIGLR
ncbi:MAG: ThiF family adenylyltransferase [Planctomycetaceae bacterium]|jgi:adenylyltransferase/sulfurtransferase|nr:ThiF family adenylyltransferase [Planctomycetaceae bacterium]